MNPNPQSSRHLVLFSNPSNLSVIEGSHFLVHMIAGVVARTVQCCENETNLTTPLSLHSANSQISHGFINVTITGKS